MDHRPFHLPLSIIENEFKQNYPFTKLSEVPPDFTAVKFFASLMNTSRIPPEMTGESFFFPRLKVFFPASAIREKERERARERARERENEGRREEEREWKRKREWEWGGGEEKEKRREGKRDRSWVPFQNLQIKSTKIYFICRVNEIFTLLYTFPCNHLNVFYPTAFLLDISFIFVEKNEQINFKKLNTPL